MVSSSDQAPADSSQQPTLHWHYTGLDDRNFQIHGHNFILLIIVFSLFLLLTILCFYARWACRYHQQTMSASPVAAAVADDVENPSYSINNSSNSNNSTTSPSSATGLDPAIIGRLPILLHRCSSSAADAAAASMECSICLTAFEDEEKVKVLPDCNHSYHPDCVDRWLVTHSNCPLCRASLLQLDSLAIIAIP